MTLVFTSSSNWDFIPPWIIAWAGRISEIVDKIDDYSEERSQPLAKGAQRTLIVARVAFCETFKTLQPIQGSSRPPDAPDGLAFDSVWADCHPVCSV